MIENAVFVITLLLPGGIEAFEIVLKKNIVIKPVLIQFERIFVIDLDERKILHIKRGISRVVFIIKLAEKRYKNFPLFHLRYRFLIPS
jgi:hypothetical protein